MTTDIQNIINLSEEYADAFKNWCDARDSKDRTATKFRRGVQMQVKELIVESVTKLVSERDEYQRCADDMAAAHKEERDGLRKAAQMALDAIEELRYSSTTHTAATKAGKAIDALRKELSE